MKKQLYTLIFININVYTNPQELSVFLDKKNEFWALSDYHQNIFQINSTNKISENNDHMIFYNKIITNYQEKKNKGNKLEFNKKEAECIYLFITNIINLLLSIMIFIFPIFKFFYIFLSICLTIKNGLYYTHNPYLSFMLTGLSVLLQILIIVYGIFKSMGGYLLISIIIINLCITLINFIYLLNIWKKKQLL